jgi:hypothetical protein
MRLISDLSFGGAQARRWRHCAHPRTRFLAGLAILGALTTTLSGSAVSAGRQPACSPRPEILAILAERYKEALVGVGLADGGNLIELLTSPAGRTWTLIITTPKGATCLLAAGEDWQADRTTALRGRGI